MTDKPKQLKLYPSGMGFAIGATNMAESQNGCFRYKQLSQGCYSDIHSFYKSMGENFEIEYQKTLKSIHSREVPFRIQLTDKTQFSGRCDFLFKDMVVECKSSASASIQTKLNKDLFKLDHLAQLASYMMHFGKSKGLLVYGFFKRDMHGVLFRSMLKKFKVTLVNKEFLVNGTETGYGEENITDFIQGAVKALESDKWSSKPHNNESQFGGPCSYCPIKAVCDMANEGDKITPTQRELSKVLIENQEIREPKIMQLKRKRKDV